MRYSKPIALSIIGSFLLASCGGTDDNIESDLQVTRQGDEGFVAYFAPSSSVIPFPSNLLFTGTTDQTLNIPVNDATDYADPKVAMNTLDGFSTIAPISSTFSSAIDSSTLNAQTVHLYEVTLSGFAGAVTGVVRELNYGTEFVASLSSVDTSNKTVAISPLAPLKPKTSYMVAFTNGIQSTDGRVVLPDVTYKLAKQSTPLVVNAVSQVPTLSNDDATSLEPLRQATNLQELALAGQGINSDLVVLSWTFTTQSISDVLTTVRTNATGVASGLTFAGDTGALLGVGANLANVYVGALTLPYYLTNSSTPTDPLTKFWTGTGGSFLTQANTTPVKTSDETVPLLLSVPKTAKPGGGWPVVIFQHGITSDRTNMLAIADTLASVGFAVVAIDLPLHGLPSTSGLYSGIERTFNLDLVNNTTGASEPDGTADTSGKHYINLLNLAVTRDNVRQSIADLFALYNSLAAMDYDTGGADFDTSKVYFLGHSLGAMVGTPFLALETGVRDAVLGMPGSGIAKLLDGSASFGPVIAAGLAGAGVNKGSANYESFMGAAQTMVDSGDPGNYASAAATGRGVLQFEVIGDGGSNLPDQVIPNNVMAAAPEGAVPAPLSGTDPFASLLGLTNVSASAVSASDQLAQIRFTAGDHSSILDPTTNSTVTTVMQTATATFLASDGLSVSISDTSVVE